MSSISPKREIYCINHDAHAECRTTMCPVCFETLCGNVHCTRTHAKAHSKAHAKTITVVRPITLDFN